MRNRIKTRVRLLGCFLAFSIVAVGAAQDSKSSREAAVREKIERLKGIVRRRQAEGNPPREQEKTIRDLESAVRERDVDRAEQLADVLLVALAGKTTVTKTGPDDETKRRLRNAFYKAQTAKDDGAIASIVAEMRAAVGGSLAEPEEAVKPERPPADSVPLTNATLPGAFAPMLAEIERMKFWHIGLDPTKLTQFPRAVGSVAIGCLAARRAGCAEPERLLATARDAGDFLVWAQEQGGTGVFPFPARRNGEGKVWQIAERAMRAAEAQGRLDEMVHHGWCVEDAGLGDDGGLQIENAVCAIAVLHLYEATKEEKYLRSVRAAGDWAIARPCVLNWNYNSFSVWLLAELHRVTGDARYLAAAKEKTRLGVLPGQLTDGPRAGRWFDPHNARPNYHYILTRALACLLPRLAAEDELHEPVLRSLGSALLAWNPTFARDGAPNTSSAGEALALLELRLPDHVKVLGATETRPALLTLERLGTAAIAAGKRPGDPSAWGLILEAAAARN